MLEQGYCIRLATEADGEAICALMRRAFDYGDGSNAALTTTPVKCTPSSPSMAMPMW